MTPIDKLVQNLGHPGVALQLGLLLGCLALAYGVCWLAGRRQPPDSVWFGRAIVDGLMFPLLSLGLAYVAMVGLGRALQPVVLLRMAVAILLALAGIRFLARVFTRVFPSSGLARMVERLFSWMAWLAVVLWIVGLLPVVLTELDDLQIAFGKTRISVLDLLQGVLSSGAVLVLALWLSATLEKRVLAQAVHDLSLRKVAANALRALLLMVGLLFALSAAGVDITALSVFGGAIGVGLGFGLQKLAANYVSGFVILFERSMRIGDTVKVDNFEGVVTDIKTRYTLIRAGNGREAIIPNEKVITERVENLSLADTRLLLTIDVSVDYDSDVDEVQRLLCEAALASDRVRKDPPPVTQLARLGADGLEFSLLFWINEPAHAGVRSEINLRIVKSLRTAGIVIAKPRRAVQVTAPATDAEHESGFSASARAATG